MNAHIVVGANYGDEGKGQVTAELISKLQPSTVLNVLTNGGSQRGHTVIDTYDSIDPKKEIYHVFHHLGAGTLYGVDNYFLHTFILNPMNFCRELHELEDLGFDFNSIDIYRDSECRWSTPWDMIANQRIEDARGDTRHGSVGVGIWETVSRYEYQKRLMTFTKFVQSRKDEKNYYLDLIQKIEADEVENQTGKPLEKDDIFWSKGLRQHFLDDCDEMYARTIETRKFKTKKKYQTIVFENGQGLELSEDYERRSSYLLTPSKTGCAYAVESIKRDLDCKSTMIHYVTRPYVTKHGPGQLEHETEKDKISPDIMSERTNVTNQYQGEFRYGWLHRNIHELVLRDYNIAKKKLDGMCDYVIDITHCEEYKGGVEYLLILFGPCDYHYSKREEKKTNRNNKTDRKRRS